MYHLICSIIVYIFITKFDAFHPVCQELRYQPRSASRLHGPAAQKHAPARSWKRLIWKTLTWAMHPSQRFMRWSTGRSQWAIMKSLLIAAETHTTRTIRKDMICPKFVSCDESMPHVFLAILNTAFVFVMSMMPCFSFCCIPVHCQISWNQHCQKNSLQDLHSRDLPVIRNELGANTLLLAPWSFKHRSHSQFLKTAAESDLRIIPSFDISWYWKDGAWALPATHETLKKDFHDFLQYSAAVINEKLSTPDTILMWNLVGLPSPTSILPVSCVAGAKTNVDNFRNCISSTGDLADVLNTVQSLQGILQTIRETQHEFHCEDQRPGCDARDDVAGAFKFDRPLGLTVELGPEFFLSVPANDEYLAALIFWLERIVGCHAVAAGQVQVPTSLEPWNIFAWMQVNSF